MERRRKRYFIVAALVFLGLIAIQSTMFVRPRRSITIEIDGDPGQSVVAAFDVDGERREESRQLPTKFSFQARHVSFFVTPEEPGHESYITVNAYIANKHRLLCRDTRGVKGNVDVPSLLGLGSNNTGIGGIRPAELR